MKTQFPSRYLQFRQVLSNDQLQMFQQTLRILTHQGIKEGALIEVRAPAVSPLFCVYVARHAHMLSLLGGHWLRKGEPTKDFLVEMKGLLTDLAQGRELK